MFIVLNGPLGIGKSRLAEALCESIDQCVMLDGDHVVATNPVHPDSLTHLHSTLALLVQHHRRFGYRHFVIDHFWQTPAELADLRRHLGAVDSAGEGAVPSPHAAARRELDAHPASTERLGPRREGV